MSPMAWVGRSVRFAAVALGAVLPGSFAAATEPPRFTEEREAAALHFVRKHCPELTPLLDELKKSNRPSYELQIRETFQVTELLADLQDDSTRYALELKIWKAENKAMVLVAKLATTKEDDRKAVENQLRGLARELVDLEVQEAEHRVKVLDRELMIARDELTKARDGVDRAAREKYEGLLEKARKKRGGA